MVFGLARIDLGEVQHIVDQREKMLLASSDARDVLSLFGVEGTADPHRQQLGVPADGVERRAELVTHTGEKFGFRLARRPGFLLCFLPFFDVDADAEPGGDGPGRIATRAASRQKPAVVAVLRTQAELDLEVLSLAYGLLPARDRALPVFRMNHLCPGVSE